MPEEGAPRPTAAGAAGASAGVGAPGALGGRVTGPSTAPTTPPTTGDWASETADRIDQLVATVRSQTTDRLVSIARLIVFGLLAAVMGVMALILLLIAAIRALDELIPQEVWVVYLGLGAIFTVAGLFLWSKKERPPSAA